MTGLLASVGVTHVVSGVLAVSLAGYVIHKSVNGKADSTDSSNDEKETKEGKYLYYLNWLILIFEDWITW